MIALKMLLGVDYFVAKMLYSAFYKDSNPMDFSPFELHVRDPRIQEALLIIQSKFTELRRRKGSYGSNYWNVTMKKLLMWLITVRENVYRPFLDNTQRWHQLTDEIFEDFFEHYEYENDEFDQTLELQTLIGRPDISGVNIDWPFNSTVLELERSIGNEFIGHPDWDFPDYTSLGQAVLVFNRLYVIVRNLPEGPLAEDNSFFPSTSQNWTVPGYKKNFCEEKKHSFLNIEL